MARLNDPPLPLPVESIDALKRRFIRQNREIARVNSTQSLRIRNLEAEISRLLAENIAIREQAINIAQESERWRTAHKVTSEVIELKNRLETKLQEVNSLVTELGTLPEKAARRTSSQRKSIVGNSARSPDQKDWRSRQTIGGVIAGQREEQEGRLPAILEDKSYPRKTLDTADIQSQAENDGNALESPDLGPPPVAHFDAPEPIDWGSINQRQEDPKDVLQLSVNLETRRKRRTSAFLQDMAATEEDFKKEAETDSVAVQPVLKAGAKRKLDANDLEEKNKNRPVTSDNFVFQWKSDNSAAPAARRGASRFSKPASRVALEQSAHSASPAKNAPAIRKVLAPQSVNSPTRRKVIAGEKAIKFVAEHPKLPTSRNPEDCIDVGQLLHEEQQASNLPPKTPAALDLLSPSSTEPSARNQVQEMAITNSVEDVLNGSIGRGSRRAKAAVSYAEPNLRDKMRRPGKELVGAVEGIDKHRERGDSLGRSQSEDPTPRVVVVKKEQPAKNEGAGWKEHPHAKEEAPSPLRDKSSRTPEDIKEHARRLNDELENAVSRLSIFDPPVSSPAKSPESDGQEQQKSTATSSKDPFTQRKGTTIKARRHSVNPGNISHGPSRSVSDTRPFSRHSQQAMGSRPSSAASVRAGEVENTRPSTMPDLKRVGSSSSLAQRERSGSGILKSGGSGKLEGLDVNLNVNVAETRGSRRRSMMI